MIQEQFTPEELEIIRKDLEENQFLAEKARKRSCKISGTHPKVSEIKERLKDE